MSELLVCKNQYNGSIGFFSYNSEKMFVYNEKIEKKNLYAVAKVAGSYEAVKVIGLAHCLVDKLTLRGNVVELIEIDEEQINASYYDLKEEKEDGKDNNN